MALPNDCNFIGRLTADPELKTNSEGKASCTFTLAVDRGKDDEADFIRFRAMDSQAQNLCKYKKKGDELAVSGAYRRPLITDKNGNKQHYDYIAAYKIIYLRGVKSSSGGGDDGNRSGSYPDEDGLPF